MDPPINGLRIQPIPSSEDGHGFLVIHVPQSIHAPHGFGKPPEAFVRRADRSEPMTMRDMQNVFWEARARRERIDAEIAASKDSFAKHAIRDRCVGYGFCAVSNDEIHISNIIQYLRMRSDERIPGLFGTDPIWSAAHSPENGLKWEPFSRGATQRFGHDMNSPHSRGSWSVDDHGVVSLYGDVSGAVGDSIAPSGPAESFRISPQDFVGALKQLLDLARLISFAGERPSTKWVIWGSVKASSSNFFVDKGRYETQKVDLTDAVDFRPVSIDLDNVSTWGDFLERRIWEFFNLHPAASLRYLAEAFVREWNWR